MYMLRSMTGYGSGEAAFGEQKITVEVRSVNHRFLDVTVRIAKNYQQLESDIKKVVASCAARGKADVTVQVDSQQGGTVNLKVDTAKARQVYAMLQQIKEDVLVPGDINLSTILPFKDIFFKEGAEDIDLETFWESLKPSLEQALQALQQMQLAEGQEIARDMLQRLQSIEQAVQDIELQAPEALKQRQQTLKERIATLCNGVAIDEQRMLQEIALLADRSDITEELVRAKSHIRQYMQWLDTQEPVGRKLDFLLQEMNREVNTIGSKASDASISMKVVIIKNELEKIREQVQNVM